MIANLIKALVFGIVEGITEWLPVSSTAHLELMDSFLHFTNVGEHFVDVFDVVIQLGAIMAVVVLYFKNIWPLKFKEVRSEHSRMKKKKLVFDMDIIKLWIKIIIACLPAVLIVVVGLDDIADKYFHHNYPLIAAMLIIVGIIFIIIENHQKKKIRVNSINELTYKDVIIIGIFQVIAALLPGTSRSGMTIIGALLIGVSRPVAAEYTFYLAIPAMAGASLLKILKYGLGFGASELFILAFAMFVAFAVSLFIIKFMMSYIKKHDFKIFGWYRIVLGIGIIILSFLPVF